MAKGERLLQFSSQNHSRIQSYRVQSAKKPGMLDFHAAILYDRQASLLRAMGSFDVADT